MSNQKVGVFVEFENKKDNNLGMPLPKGIVRVYKEDGEGSLQFVGEDLDLGKIAALFFQDPAMHADHAFERRHGVAARSPASGWPSGGPATEASGSAIDKPR